MNEIFDERAKSLAQSVTRRGASGITSGWPQREMIFWPRSRRPTAQTQAGSSSAVSGREREKQAIHFQQRRNKPKRKQSYERQIR